MKAVDQWTYIVDSSRPVLSAEEATANVTITFTTTEVDEKIAPGRWLLEMRTPKTEIPWLAGTEGVQRVGVSDANPGESVAVISSIRLDSNVVGTNLQ